MDTIDISKYYSEAQAAWGEAALPPYSEIRVTLEAQMTRSFGRAFGKVFRRRNGQVVRRDYYAITISAPWLQAILTTCGKEVAKAQLRDTAIHELAHIATYHMYPGHKIGHGYEWQRLMDMAGLPTNARVDTRAGVRLPGTNITWQQVKQAKDEED